MCLGIPGQLTEIFPPQIDGLPMARVDFGGVSKEICLALIPDAQVGDYVMVHVGFAISRVDKNVAEETFALLTQMEELAELETAESS